MASDKGLPVKDPVFLSFSEPCVECPGKKTAACAACREQIILYGYPLQRLDREAKALVENPEFSYLKARRL